MEKPKNGLKLYPMHPSPPRKNSKTLTQKWGEKRDHESVLTELNAIRKKPKEDILEFIKGSISNIITFLLR